jgi:outer membrane receptor protein involved in Fe transport
MQLREMIRLAQGFAGLAAYTNLGKARITGFDVEAKADLTDWLYAAANLTYQDARDVERLTPGTQVTNPTYQLRLPHLPWLFGGATVDLHTADLLGAKQQSRVFYEASYTEEYFYAFELSRRQERRIPRALTHTVGLEQQWFRSGITLSAELQNLTDERVLNQFNQPLPGRSFRIKARYTWVPRPAALNPTERQR